MKSKLKTNAQILILFFFLVFSFDFVNAQQLNKIYEGIGGGGTNNVSVEENNDNTMLYVVGGAVIVGIVVYAVLQSNKKSENKEKQDKDTTSSLLNKNLLSKNVSLKEKLLSAQSKLPVNIFFGYHQDKLVNDGKRYFVGLSYSF